MESKYYTPVLSEYFTIDDDLTLDKYCVRVK